MKDGQPCPPLAKWNIPIAVVLAAFVYWSPEPREQRVRLNSLKNYPSRSDWYYCGYTRIAAAFWSLYWAGLIEQVGNDGRSGVPSHGGRHGRSEGRSQRGERSITMPRPIPKFHNFVGHKKVVDLLRRQLEGVQARGEPFPHTLITGASGLGKTLLAEALAAEYDASLVKTIGDISKAGLVDRLVALSTNDFLFIDEAHALKRSVQELLYEAIDNLWVPRVPDSVAASAPQQEGEDGVTIKPCTILLASDLPGGLSNALQKRMALRVALNYYPIDELKEIVERLASDIDVLLSPHAARLIAQVSVGLPRRAKQYLQTLRNHFSDSEKQQVSVPQVREFLAAFGIDDKGLGTQDRQYLDYLKDVGAASLESLAICLGLDCDFVRRQIESVLLRQRLVKIGPSGRTLTPMGLDWINKPNINRKDPSTDGQNQSGQTNP